MTAPVRPADTVPADIQLPEVELAAIAIFLRAGIYGEAIPTCETPSLIRAVTQVATRLTWRPFERPA